MKYLSLAKGSAKISLALFRSASAYTEMHGVIRCEAGDYSVIPDNLKQYVMALAETVGDGAVLMSARFMVADDELGGIIEKSDVCAGSARTVVVQPPLDGSAVAVWLVWTYVTDKKEIGNNLVMASCGPYKLLWQGDTAISGVSSYTETASALNGLAETLQAAGGTLAESCRRTWFMVRDIDRNYRGLVEARNEVFEKHSLTRENHFIASTGIGGSPVMPSRSIVFNSYSVLGLPESDVTYLKASDKMNNTMDYGVAFERGTILRFPGHRQILISGTASIDNHGRIVHEGDVAGQTLRMLENIEALIAEAGAENTDMCYGIVYLRNPEDYTAVAPIIEARYPEIPLAIVHAPVCRRGWLVEMECALLL